MARAQKETETGARGAVAAGADCAHLFGHRAQEQQFLTALYGGRMHHAWLLTGPKGVGKASFAWLAAKHILSGKAEEDGLFGPPEPPASLKHDPEDSFARRIQEGGHGDVRLLEIGVNEKTGKRRSEITIQQVQALSKLFTQTSAEGGWRVVIIDAVDDLNRSAANALLKMLEEPPAKVAFFLVSHSPGRLLPTIRSRCRQLVFTRLDDAAMQDFMGVSFAEMGKEAVDGLAALAQGAPGRAVALADLDASGLLADLAALFQSSGTIDVPALQRFAGSLARADQDARHALAVDCLLDALKGVAFGESGSLPEALQPLAQALAARLDPITAQNKWQELGTMATQQERLRLDRSFFWVHVISQLKA